MFVSIGGVAEWSKATVLKTVERKLLGFESLLLLSVCLVVGRPVVHRRLAEVAGVAQAADLEIVSSLRNGLGFGDIGSGGYAVRVEERAVSGVDAGVEVVIVIVEDAVRHVREVWHGSRSRDDGAGTRWHILDDVGGQRMGARGLDGAARRHQYDRPNHPHRRRLRLRRLHFCLHSLMTTPRRGRDSNPRYSFWAV